MAKAIQFFCALLVIVMLFEYHPVSGRPNSVPNEDPEGTVDEQSPDFRHRWGSQQYHRPGQHYRPSSWSSTNTGTIYLFSSKSFELLLLLYHVSS